VVGAKYGPDKDGDGIGDGVALSQFVESGSEDCSYAIGQGNLPGGMVLSGNGKLRNSPNVLGDFPFTVLATDSAGTTESPLMTVTVIDNGNHGDGQSVTYALEGPNSAFSVYEWFKATTLDPNGEKGESARFLQVQDVNGRNLFVVRVKASGKLVIEDTDGNALWKGENFFAEFSTDESARWRATGVVGFTGTSAQLNFKAYGNLESAQYTDVFPVSVPSTTAPYQVELGNKSGEVYNTVDTWETSPLPQEIPAFEPGGIANLTPLYTLTGPGASSTSVRVHAKFSPVNASQTANVAYSTSEDMAGPTLVGSQVIDVDGIARWSVTGLTAATQYHGRVVDTSTGAYIGDAFGFRTLP
jgi:hypothetical protein